MITDEERREVAQRLREIADGNEGHLGRARMATVLNAAQVAIGALGLESVAHVLRRHADLIEPQERTCHLAETDHEYETSYRCDVCRRVVWLDFKGNPRPNYCPNCGAKVVE